MKKSEAAELVMMLLAAYPQARATDQTAQVYEQMLADLDAATARRAVHRLLASSKFMPSIAEIREACAAQTHGPRRSGEEAYAELTDAVRRHGRDYGQGMPKFRDPLIAKCLGVWGSWNDFCASPSDDPGGRARFVQLYDELASRRRQDQVAGAPLPAPRQGKPAPAFWLEQRKHEPAPTAPRPVRHLVAVATREPAANATPAAASPARPEPRAPRRWTAEELEAALGEQRSEVAS